MSIKLMSAIFETEFRDLQDSEGNVTKASTAKFVTLALADHTNDDGEGAYPSLETLSKKTSLSKQCIINTIDALKFNGIVMLMGESKYGTNNYTVNVRAFPRMEDGSQPRLLVIPVDPPSQPGLPVVANPVDPNHTLTIHKSNGANAPELDTLPIEWQIGAGVERVTLQDETAAKRHDMASLISMGFGANTQAAYELALTFQNERGITFTESDVKGQRKAIRALIEKQVKPAHISQAVQKLTAAKMTFVDLFGVVKTAVDIASQPTPEMTRLL